MRAIHRLPLILAMTALPVIASAADRNGMQFEVAGVFGLPSGSFSSAGGAALADYFAAGPGFDLTATLGVTRHFNAGARYGAFRGSKDGSVTLGDLTLPGGSAPPGSGPFATKRTLTVSEFSGVLQYRKPFRPGMNGFAEAGAGILTFVEHVKLSEGGTDLLSIGGYQQDPMWSAGAGLSFRIRKNFDVVAAGRWCQALTSNGDLWAKGDDPVFAKATLGLRYPNY